MGTASSPRKQTNDQMSTPDGLDKTFVSQNNEMRHFAHRVSRRVSSLHCAARGAIGFLRSLRSATKLSGTDARRDKKKQAYGSLSSPACSCVAITLPASSRWIGGKCPPISKSADAAP